MVCNIAIPIYVLYTIAIQHVYTNLIMFTTGTSPITRRTAALSAGGVRHQFLVIAKCDNKDSRAIKKIRYRVH